MMATRPGPLRDIPADHERLRLQSDGHIYSPFKSPGKRQLSPSSYAMCSPSKRRLVDQQNHGNTPSGSRHTSSPQAHVRAILHGPNSPARKLDFGVVPSNTWGGANNMVAESDPAHRTRSVTRRLASTTAPGPLLPSFDTSSLTPITRQPSTLLPGLESSPVDIEMKDHVSNPQIPAVSREVFPPIRASVHYPGFDIYRDSRELLFSCILAPAPSPSSFTIDASDNGDSDSETDKENVRPVRPAKSCFGEAAWAKAGLLCPREVEMLCSPIRSLSSSSRDIETVPMEEEHGEEERDRDMNMSPGTPRVPRRIRDIGNINVRPLQLHKKMMLTSSSFYVLGEDKDQDKERSRKKGEDADNGMMDVENEYEGVKNENERHG